MRYIVLTISARKDAILYDACLQLGTKVFTKQAAQILEYVSGGDEYHPDTELQYRWHTTEPDIMVRIRPGLHFAELYKKFPKGTAAETIRCVLTLFYLPCFHIPDVLSGITHQNLTDQLSDQYGDYPSSAAQNDTDNDSNADIQDEQTAEYASAQNTDDGDNVSGDSDMDDLAGLFGGLLS